MCTEVEVVWQRWRRTRRDGRRGGAVEEEVQNVYRSGRSVAEVEENLERWKTRWTGGARYEEMKKNVWRGGGKKWRGGAR